METRPGLYCKEMITAVAEEIFPKVLEWLGDEAPLPDDTEELEHVKEQVTAAIDRGLYEGYESAHYLDSHYCWSVDADLVDVFEEASWVAYHKHDEMVEQWVTRNRIIPMLKVGDQVVFTSQFKEHRGEITEVREKTAQYTIFSEELGHVRKGGPASQGIQRTGTIIAYEDVKAAV
jgi:hypothetical protein